MTIRRIEGGTLGNGTEMKPDMTPFAAGLVLFIDMDKGDFVGRNALLGKDTGPCLLGMTCGTETPLAGSVVLVGTTEVDQITAGIASPTLGLGIGYMRFNAPGDWVGRTLVMRLADTPCTRARSFSRRSLTKRETSCAAWIAASPNARQPDKTELTLSCLHQWWGDQRWLRLSWLQDRGYKQSGNGRENGMTGLDGQLETRTRWRVALPERANRKEVTTRAAPIPRPRRSFIFTPGLRPDMFPKALSTGTDIVCVELEDEIAPKDKAEARKRALSLFEQPQADDGVERIVGINSMRERFGMEDVQAILATDTPPPALMMPKVRTPDEVVMRDQLLTEAGHKTRLHVIIETNEGLQAAFEIAKCSGRIDAMFFGGVDMAAELRCQNTFESLIYARSCVVHAAAAAGLDVINVPFLDLNDPSGTRFEAEKVRDLGFAGKGTIHPKQIAALNEVFTPTEAQITRARLIIAEFEAADTGLVVINGKLIEKLLLRDMHRIVAIADRMGGKR